MRPDDALAKFHGGTRWRFARIRRRLGAFSHGRRQWRRERFFDEAQKYTPIIAVDDRNGHRYFVTTSDPALARGLFLDGTFESENVDILLDIIETSAVQPEQIIDVGANIGTSSIRLLSRMPRAFGIAFEPDKANFGLLGHNLLANGLDDRVKAINAAVSDHDNQLQFARSPQHPGDHRVHTSAQSGSFAEETWEVITVPAWSLDSMVEQGHIDPKAPSIVWIDAQGHEAQILAGAKRLRHIPTVVELWPYGLKRAGGLELFFEIVSSFEKVVELRAERRVMSREELVLRINEPDARGDYTDLLLMPSAH